VFLVNGIIWLFVSGVVLHFTDTSITTVGVIMGVVLVLAGATELVAIPAVDEPGWKPLHGAVALVFVLAGLWAFIQPDQAFWALASVLGFLLLLFYVGLFALLRGIGQIVFAFSVLSPRGEFAPS
jgi:uncharacterized membrane protein HdeD (DUF308 family)